MSFYRDRLPDPVTYFEAQGLVLTGPRSAKWRTTRCNFHDGSDSMRVNVKDGAWKCMACGAGGGDVLAYEMQATGADFVTAAKALGAWIDDGKAPPRNNPLPLPPRQALAVLRFEASLAAVAACNLARGGTLSESDRQRLLLAANRIALVSEAYQ